MGERGLPLRERRTRSRRAKMQRGTFVVRYVELLRTPESLLHRLQNAVRMALDDALEAVEARSSVVNESTSMSDPWLLQSPPFRY